MDVYSSVSGEESSESNFEYTISDNNSTITKYIGNESTVVIPAKLGGASVTAIASSAFSGKTDIARIQIPESITSIGTKAFYGCTNLQTINIPKNAALSSSGYTFFNCQKLKNVVFDSGIEKIPYCLFFKSSNLDSLTSITIPDTVTGIGGCAFFGCTALTSITLPSSVTNIRMLAFSGCTGLTAITIPSSGTSIEMGAFDSCTNLTIYGKTGSYAETYAVKYNIPFVSTGNVIITSHPQSITVIEGLSTSLSVSAAGSGYTYQWQRYSTSGWVNLIGETSPTLSLNAVTYDMNGGKYRCIVSDGSDSETSQNAKLTVKPAEQVTETELEQMSIDQVISFVNAFSGRYDNSEQNNALLTSAQIKAIERVLEHDLAA